MQCKERVDLLEALEQSRKEAEEQRRQDRKGRSLRRKSDKGKLPVESPTPSELGFIGEGSIPAVNYPDLSRPPALPARPATLTKKSTESVNLRSKSVPQINTISSMSPPPTLPVLPKLISRTPSPDKKKAMLTTLRNKDGKPKVRYGRGAVSRKPPASQQAAGLAWDGQPSRLSVGDIGQSLPDAGFSSPNIGYGQRGSVSSDVGPSRNSYEERTSYDAGSRLDPSDYLPSSTWRELQRPDSYPSIASDFQDLSREQTLSREETLSREQTLSRETSNRGSEVETLIDLDIVPPSPSPATRTDTHDSSSSTRGRPKSPIRLTKPPIDYLTYRNEYPVSSAKPSTLQRRARESASAPRPSRSQPEERVSSVTFLPKKPVPKSSTPRGGKPPPRKEQLSTSSGSGDESNDKPKATTKVRRSPAKKKVPAGPVDATTPNSTDKDSSDESGMTDWDRRVKHLMKHLPKGVDETAAKQIFNEIVVKGDEVHWDDVAGLEIAKKALKEAVVYPFLRPDLFMGLREPARGMLLFGPPGTGKTMLARAVATESKSTFFAISASSLTSKWLGESEKLVRALFQLAKALAPSIIFVDEIDSLLSARAGSSEHETSRRIKTEFLIQWSDLQRAAAGRDQTDKEKKEGDASRVLVLAATNMPWAIDEAARRRFVRRQYIPLPEGHVRAVQLNTLLSHQKHDLSEEDIQVLVEVTNGKICPFLILRCFDIDTNIYQASLAPTSPLSQRMQPWDHFVVSAKPSCTCPWTRFALSHSLTLKTVW
jgi:fidgetin-like protein 1